MGGGISIQKCKFLLFYVQNNCKNHLFGVSKCPGILVEKLIFTSYQQVRMSNQLVQPTFEKPSYQQVSDSKKEGEKGQKQARKGNLFTTHLPTV